VLAIRATADESVLADVLQARVAAGARLVRFESCMSLLLFTIRRQSPVYITTSWQERYLRGLGYSLVTVLLGPWAVPWGLIWTVWAIWVNLTGGVDETDQLLAELTAATQQPNPREAIASLPGPATNSPS
jgi:hypothetical protein